MRQTTPARKRGPDSNWDPVHASAPLSFHRKLFPFGFAAQISSNHNAVVEAFEYSWGNFEQRFDTPAINLRFLVGRSRSRQSPDQPVFRAQGNLLTIVANSRNFASCDLRCGFAFAFVTEATVKDRDYFRYNFLDAMVSSLLDTRYFLTLHAACVAKEGEGVLLIGNSGAGKSTLSYACARRGWTLTSDDSAALVLSDPGRLLVGNPHRIRFRPEAAKLFPEVSGPIQLRNGKPTIEVTTQKLAGINIAQECRGNYLIFLNRLESEPERPQLTRVSIEHCRKVLSNNPWPADLGIHQCRTMALERLLAAEAYTLTYGNLDAAVRLLERTIAYGT